MKYRWLEPLKEWFGYSRRERKSTFILLGLIVFAAVLRYVVPPKNIDIEEIPVSVLQEAMDEKPVAHFKSGIKRSDKQQSVVTTSRIVELNSCDSATLESLPGIGPVLARRIIRYRNLLGGYADVGQLKEVYGLNEEVYNLLKARFSADISLIKKIPVNEAAYGNILRLPYFEKQEVNAILDYRRIKGKINQIRDLTDNMIITPEKAERVKAYLDFR